MTEPKGWILYHLAEELERRLPYVVIDDARDICPITYFIPYYYHERSARSITVAFFTHCEEGEDERSREFHRRFFEVAREADYCVSMNRKYAGMLREASVQNLEVITPGVDLSVFRPKLRLGWLGRHYWSGRKNEEFVKALEQFDWLEVCYKPSEHHWSVGGVQEGEELARFYRSFDYVLVVSTAEGGPMSVVEGLACGVPAIMPEGVGLWDHFSQGIITFEKNNFDSLVSVLRRLWLEKMKLAEQAQAYALDQWAEQHDGLFRRLRDGG